MEEHSDKRLYWDSGTYSRFSGHFPCSFDLDTHSVRAILADERDLSGHQGFPVFLVDGQDCLGFPAQSTPANHRNLRPESCALPHCQLSSILLPIDWRKDLPTVAGRWLLRPALTRLAVGFGRSKLPYPPWSAGFTPKLVPPFPFGIQRPIPMLHDHSFCVKYGASRMDKFVSGSKFHPPPEESLRARSWPPVRPLSYRLFRTT